MGGYGSGRSGGRPTVEHGLTLDLYRLLRLKAIAPGQSLGGSIVWIRVGTGERTASVGYEARLTGDSGRIRLHYARSYGGESEPRITGSHWRQRRNRSEDGAGGFDARERMTWSANFTCRAAPARSPRGAPIGSAIFVSARRRVIAPCPGPSRCGTKSAARAGSATTFQSRRVCTTVHTKSLWRKSLKPKRSSNGTRSCFSTGWSA